MAKKTVKKKHPKTREVYVIKGNYGYGGYEDLTQENTYMNAKIRIREYRDNERNASHKLITRRVPYFSVPKREEINDRKEVEAYLKKMRERRLKKWKITQQ